MYIVGLKRLLLQIFQLKLIENLFNALEFIFFVTPRYMYQGTKVQYMLNLTQELSDEYGLQKNDFRFQKIKLIRYKICTLRINIFMLIAGHFLPKGPFIFYTKVLPK